MNGPNREGFWKACQTEIKTLEDMDVWEVVARQSWMNVLPGTWAFKIKRFPDGLIRKLKARFCVRGDKQIYGTDFFDTYAAVVKWETVRLMLVLSAQLSLATKQVDFTAAFVHADIDLPPGYENLTQEEKDRSGVYVEMPRGFAEPGKVLKLKKNLYGLKQAPRNWGKHRDENLKAVGFRQCVDVDSCLFMSDHVVCLAYVDDVIFLSRDMAEIDKIVAKLRARKMELEEESDVSGFLGVHIERENGKVILTQKGLTQRIIEALQVQDLPGVATPADRVLGKDLDGDPATCSFNMASVIGMSQYLYGHSRADIGFALSQVSRFAFNPKRSHELAMIRIGQYLKATSNKGLIMEPLSLDELKMDVYVDSDFMGLYGKEKRIDPDNVKSRAGFVISLNGCPLIWKSKLIDSICLSTMMAEYYALSMAMREVLPLRGLIKEVARELGVGDDCLSTFKCTVYEDNNGCLTLANLDPGQATSRSKFYDVRVHWFRSHLTRPDTPGVGRDDIRVIKIDTTDQIADIFTKPLSREPFEKLRKVLMGW